MFAEDVPGNEKEKPKPCIHIHESDYEGIADLQLQDEVVIVCKGRVQQLEFHKPYTPTRVGSSNGSKEEEEEYEARIVDLSDLEIKVVGNTDTKKATQKMLNMNPLANDDD
jgi:hypothetical protein